jgi:hypothetical protein
MKKLTLFAAMFVALLTTSTASAQDAYGLGGVEFVTPETAVVSGVVLDNSYNDSTLLLESTDELGNVQSSVIDIAVDGSFLLIGNPDFITGSTSILPGELSELGTGNAVGRLVIVTEVPFEDWFDHWSQNPSGQIVPLLGRPCLYNHDSLSENHSDCFMEFGDYFPSWPDEDYSLEENLHYIEVLVESGGPTKDTHVDDDNLPIDDDPDEDSTLDQERMIIEAAGYIWDESIPGWRVPDGYIWDDVEKKWKPAT